MYIHNLPEYIKTIALEDQNYFAEAIKTATVKARRVKENEMIKTKTSDGLFETVNVGIKDEKGELGWVVTNPSGEQYIINNDEFNKTYTQMQNGEYIKGKPVLTMKLEENITFNAPWGEEMKVKSGGYLIINGKDDIYGIQEVSFNETYRMTDRPKYEAYMEVGEKLDFDEDTIEEMKFNNLFSQTVKDIAADIAKDVTPRIGDLDKILAEIKDNEDKSELNTEKTNENLDEQDLDDDTVL